MVKAALLATTAGTPIEIWFQDEARVGQNGTHEYVWAPIGSRPAMVRDNRHDSVYLYGAICPARGVGAAIIMPAANTEGMNSSLTIGRPRSKATFFWMSMTASARRSWSVRRLLSRSNWACSAARGLAGARLGPRLTAFRAS